MANRPQYFCRETVKMHEENIKYLLDLNYGKNWKVFMNLFYCYDYGYHAFNFRNPTPEETKKFKNINFAGIVRKVFYSGCMNIMKSYFFDGMKKTVEDIEDNKYRFVWSFNKGEERQIIISDDLYNEIHNIKTQSQELEEKTDEENIDESELEENNTQTPEEKETSS